MKLSIIYEATIDQVQNKIPIWTKKYFNGNQEKAIETIQNLLSADPTRGIYTDWIIKQFKNKLIRVPEDNIRIRDVLFGFEKVKKRLDNKDINFYNFHDLENIVDQLLGVDSSPKKHDYSDLNGIKIVSKNGPYKILAVTDPESLKKLGEGTKWCTRGSYKDCMANSYITQFGLIYVVLQDGRPVMQYTPDYSQIMDINDKDVTDKKLLSLIPKPALNENPEKLCMYAMMVRRDRWPEAEPFIMKDPYSAAIYALYVIKGRWPEAESTILKYSFHESERYRELYLNHY